jgi:23S rRNA (uridine2552-2'-O)-methyltransferase
LGKRWMRERKRDTYYLRAKKEDYRSRAAYKLLQLQARFNIMFEGMRCLDLGAAPGGWLQVELEIAGKGGRVIGVDIASIKKLEGAIILRGDIADRETQLLIKDAVEGSADVVLSDMAPNISGNYDLDHERSVELVNLALGVAENVLAAGGTFVAKMFEGRRSREVMERISERFDSVRISKPAASRKQSSETYIVACGFKGRL